MTSWIVFTVFHLVSLGFAVLTLRRLYHYIGRYRFDESKYTLLFGFMHLHWLSGVYVFCVFAWIAVSCFLFTIV